MSAPTLKMPPEGQKAAADARSVLSSGIAALGLSQDDRLLDRLLAYQSLLGRWGRVYNLTALHEPSQVLVQHLLDSLSIVGPLQRQLGLRAADSRGGRPWRLLDVGSGAGLPGVVIALLLPAVDVVCVDAVAKKSSFVRQVGLELGLGNLSACHSRVEALRGTPFDVAVSRAFASLADFVALTAHCLAPDGVWLAMKGRHPADELAQLPSDIDVFHVEPIHVPGLQAERCLVWMRRR